VTTKPSGIPWSWLAVAALAAAALAGYWLTGGNSAAPSQGGALTAAILQPLRRDLALEQTAEALAASAATPHERALAAQAITQARALVQTSFAVALYQSDALPPLPSSAVHTAAEARIASAQAALASDRQQAASHNAAAAALGSAQLQLDQARLDDAAADAKRTLVTPADAIARMERQYKAQLTTTPLGNTAAVATASGLLGTLQRGWQLDTQARALEAAAAAANRALPAMALAHDHLQAALNASEQAHGGDAATLTHLRLDQQQVSRFDQLAKTQRG
jgi:hypothetical protein